MSTHPYHIHITHTSLFHSRSRFSSSYRTSCCRPSKLHFAISPYPHPCLHLAYTFSCHIFPFFHKRLDESLEHYYPNLTSIDNRLLYKLTFPFSRPCSLPSSRPHGKQNIKIGFYPAGHHPAIINITDIIQSLCILTCQPSVPHSPTLSTTELEVPCFIALISPRSLHHTLPGAA